MSCTVAIVSRVVKSFSKVILKLSLQKGNLDVFWVWDSNWAILSQNFVHAFLFFSLLQENHSRCA